MKFLTRQIVFREVPDEVSLSYLVTGCPLRCHGCHSADSWNPKLGHELSREILLADIERYKSWITCVLFMGGDWHKGALIDRLNLVREKGMKTALYTGLEQIPRNILDLLDYVKVGPYVQTSGGLDCEETNQRLIDLRTGKVLNGYFINNREVSDDWIE